MKIKKCINSPFNPSAVFVTAQSTLSAYQGYISIRLDFVRYKTLAEKDAEENV